MTSIPEPQPDFSPRTLQLEEVWNLRQPSDQQTALAIFFHHLRLAFVFLAKSPLTSLLSTLSVATVLFILGLLLTIQRASFFGISELGGDLGMSVFMLDNASEKDWEGALSLARSFPGMSAQRRVDKSSALKELEKILAEQKQVLSGLDVDNPLPASLELNFSASAGASLPGFAEQLKRLSGVESVVFDGQMAQIIADIGARLRGAGRVSSVVLIGLTLFLIATTIRISLYHEQEEIEIMALVGAYPAFVQAPFIIGGALQGLLGFMVASLGLDALQGQLSSVLGQEQILQAANISFPAFGSEHALLLASLGVGAGLIGSFLASRHFR